jgi:uncharacterized membrane protein YvlD (DUF360 family)
MKIEQIAVMLAVNAVLLYGLTFLFGGRIKFGGIVPVLSVVVFLVPINVFMREILRVVGLPDQVHYVFLGAVVLNGVMLYALSYIIPRVTVETLGAAVAFSLLMGLVSLFLAFFLADQLAGRL